jgi:fructosamine-3-kinase
MSPLIREALNALVYDRYKLKVEAVNAVSGGSINKSYRVNTNGRLRFFCKTNEASGLPAMFEKEKNGIDAIAKTGSIAVPGEMVSSQTGDEQWLLMEWIDEGRTTKGFWKNFGASLAAMHRFESSSFGFHESNYMGALPQSNTIHDRWECFFISERLVPQVTLACRKGYISSKEERIFERLYLRLDVIFSAEKPCLVHGDLWNGNFICDQQAHPVLIDPAVYYGNRNVDLAMTTLFGGFDDVFYEAYNYYYPFPANYKEQWKLLNLYPLLIHLNLFGKSYLSSILGTIAAY